MPDRAETATSGPVRMRPLQPARTVFAAFALAAIVGTVLLMLPAARSGPGSATFMEALFHATSALCVTGLVTVDVPVHWSAFGEGVILGLIQVGGFGVMTFASVVGLAVVRKMSFRSRVTAAAEAKSSGLDNVRSLVLGIVKISLAVEGICAVILSTWFFLRHDKDAGEAVWLGVFHAVSSFNNAGFSLFSDNIMSYVTDPVVSLTLCAATILGGLGFPVIMQLRRHWRRPLAWSMNTRLVLWGTVVLLVSGTVFITAMEWRNPGTLGGLDGRGKILAGFFHSVQTRTAGFNSVNIGEMDSATWLGMNALMFIGGGPAGTAGGIKITTFAVLFFIILTEIRSQGAVNVLGKRLSRAVHRQAISVALLAVALVVVSTLILMLMTDFTLDQLLFEVVSAFATVGLSTGITASLPPAGQVVLIALMFIGRLGPITFASALAFRERPRVYELPKERPIIG